MAYIYLQTYDVLYLNTDNKKKWEIFNILSMGQQHPSNEAFGVNCGICGINLPPNNGAHNIYCGFYCFYDFANRNISVGYSLTNQLSSKVNEKNGGQVFKYFRRVEVNVYKCPRCFSRTESKNQCQNLDLILNDIGVIIEPSDEQRQAQNLSPMPASGWGQNFTSYHGLRTRGYPNGKVDSTSNNDSWEKWSFQSFDNYKFFIRSSQGTYLRAHPNKKVDLTTNKRDWEIWTKVNKNGDVYWKSYHGTYLRGTPEGKVDLADQPRQWERWK